MKSRVTKKNILILLSAAIIFFIMTMPFRIFFRVVPVTEVRPASALNPVFGLVFGIHGALGCALGNFVADMLSGYSVMMSLLSFFVQLFSGLFPYYAWTKKEKNIRLNTAKNVFRFMVIMLLDASITAILLGVVMQITHMGAVFSMTTVMLFLNNFVFCMVLGLPILLLFIGQTIKQQRDTLSLNERFILFFLFLAILSAALIGIISYGELQDQYVNMLDFWNRIYIYISINLGVFCVSILLFLRYAERNITVPMEQLALMADDYIHSENDGQLDTKNIVERSHVYATLPGEVGRLAEAFRDMAFNLGQYVENLKLVTAERERIGAELNVAKKIQADMLPNVIDPYPDRAEFSIYASMDPAKEVGGDFYDFFLLDKDHLALVIADVSDKGVPAALFMVIVKTLIKNQAKTGQSAQEILRNVNDQLCENNKEKMFATVWLGILDIPSGKMVCANAGHEYPIIKDGKGDFTLYKDRHGLVLAGMKGFPYKEYELQLKPEDILFVYTDGVSEAMNGDKKFYGMDRIVDVLNAQEMMDPEHLIHQVSDDIQAFVGDAKQFDDITMLCLKYNGPSSDQETIEIEADVKNWPEVQSFLASFLERKACPLKAQLHIETAVEEIFVNISSYAYPNKNGNVSITVSKDDQANKFQVIFKDQGLAWDPLSKADPDITLPSSKRTLGGLGIFMVKKLMNHTHYERSGDENVFTIEKRIS